MAPTATATLDMPAETSTTDGRVKHSEHSNFALGSSLRNVSVAAQLFPFDFKLQRTIGIHRGLRQSESSGNKLFPETDDAVIQIEPTTVLGLSQLNLERTGSLSQSSAKFIRMWRINFLTSFEAAHFARVWHQKPLPKLGNEDLHEPSPHVKAECIFR